MSFAFDGEPRRHTATCPSCGSQFPFVTAFVTRDESASAIVYAACHTHGEVSEAWLDVVIGSFREPELLALALALPLRTWVDTATGRGAPPPGLESALPVMT